MQENVAVPAKAGTDARTPHDVVSEQRIVRYRDDADAAVRWVPAFAGTARNPNLRNKNTAIPAKAVIHAQALTVFYVYLLASKPNGTLYVGSTSNLVRRVWEHKLRAVPGFTAKYAVDRLVWFESYDTLETANGGSKDGSAVGRSN